MRPNSGKYGNVMLYFRVIKSRRIKWAEHIPEMDMVQNAYKILDGKYGVKRPHARPMHK
jgi:hypothetical protein